jgi:hypothetical protein
LRVVIFLPAVACVLFIVLGAYSWTSSKAWYQIAPTIYIGQPGTPTAIENFIRPEQGCNWSGIGGQVFNIQGEPVSGLVIKVTGDLEGSPMFLLALTGGALQFGPGGYLIELADHTFASQGNLSLELLDIAGRPISFGIPLTTFSSCDKNLLIINLVEISTENNIYLPLILK